MTELWITDLRTGDRILTLPFLTENWMKAQNAADQVRATVKLSGRIAKRLDLYNATSPAKTVMSVLENGIVMAAAIIWRRSYDKATGTLELAGAGYESLGHHRQILPALAAGHDIIDPTTGASVTAYNTDLVGKTYGQMVKELWLQAEAWAGGEVPFVYQDDEAGGTYERHFVAANLTSVGKAIRDFTNLQNGVDIDYFARVRADRGGIEILVRTGTVAEPELHGTGVHMWDYSVPKPSIRNLRTVEDATEMTGQAWARGGRQDGSVVIAVASNPALVAAGYPLLESVDGSHADASEVDTLANYAAQDAVVGRAPLSAWTFEVHAKGSPKVGSFWPGDFCDIKIANDPWLRSRTYRREIASISGDQDGRWVDVTTLEVVDA